MEDTFNPSHVHSTLSLSLQAKKKKKPRNEIKRLEFIKYLIFSLFQQFPVPFSTFFTADLSFSASILILSHSLPSSLFLVGSFWLLFLFYFFVVISSRLLLSLIILLRSWNYNSRSPRYHQLLFF